MARRSVAKHLVVDSNVWVALFNPADALHRRASAAMEAHGIEAVLTTTNLVLYEVVTVLALRASRPLGIEAGEFLYREANDGKLEIVHVDEALEQASWQLFGQIRTKDVSFVDCATAIVAHALDRAPVLTFDRHFNSLGRRLGVKILA